MTEKATVNSSGDGKPSAKSWAESHPLPQLESLSKLRPGVVFMIGLFTLLLILVVLIGIPLLNAYLLAATGGGGNAVNLTGSQITANVTAVGMLVAGVFVITALSMEKTAKHTAWHAARKMFHEAYDGILRELKKQLGDVGESHKALLREQRKSHKEMLREQGESHETLLSKQQDLHEKARAPLDEFVRSEALRRVEARQDDEAMEAVRQNVLAMIEDEATRKLLLEAMLEHLTKRPDGAIERVAELVLARVRFGWLFKVRRSGGREKSGNSAVGQAAADE